MSSEESGPNEDARTLGRYQILETLRRGPITNWYRAEHDDLKRTVLLKALRSGILPSSPFAGALRREAALLTELAHPTILHLYDFVESEETLFLVMEDDDFWPLDQVMKRAATLSPSAVAALALQLTRALEHAHSHGIIHRDLQPNNIFITRLGGIKLINFSAATDQRLPTAPEALGGDSAFGLPSYMSPEQVLGETPDARSDLFSLGVICYELLSGKRPFDAPEAKTTSQRIRHDAPAPLGRLVPKLPAALERCVDRAMQKVPSDRFIDAADMATSLDVVVAESSSAVRNSVVAELHRIGLVDEIRPSLGTLTQPLPKGEGEPVRRAALGLVICLLAIALGGVALEVLATRENDSGGGRKSQELLLRPENAGFLRVVAEPWAHVIVDGQHVDTTPFAQPVSLSPGTHYIRLEHPAAPTERRTVVLRQGENVLLDVTLLVEYPAPKASEDLLLQGPSTDAAVSP
ncbi:MAG: serine/threonine protein kinase [Polyangiaceae bacterium]|nr:serine/threonine protein kinase [Polyangiaceae bacterium]